MNDIKCSPYADEKQCHFHGALDGEEWCSTHEVWRWRKWEWQRHYKKLSAQKREAKKAKEAMNA